MLEERVNDKKEQLLEKDLVLEEVSNLANRLRAQALEGRGETLELAKRVNDFQVRLTIHTYPNPIPKSSPNPNSIPTLTPKPQP